MQTNWIGRSEGAEIRFTTQTSEINHREHGEHGRQKRGQKSGKNGNAARSQQTREGAATAEGASLSENSVSSLPNSVSSVLESRSASASVEIPVFTTRPDTIYGVTFFVLAPEHPLVERLTAPEQRDAVQAYLAEVRHETEIERLSTEKDRKKTGVPLGTTVTNPVSGAQVPVWIADYVLMGYGTGAVMGVPAHDQRDFEFARAFGLPIVEVIREEGDVPSDPATWDAARTAKGG